MVGKSISRSLRQVGVDVSESTNRVDEIYTAYRLFSTVGGIIPTEPKPPRPTYPSISPHPLPFLFSPYSSCIESNTLPSILSFRPEILPSLLFYLLLLPFPFAGRDKSVDKIRCFRVGTLNQPNPLTPSPRFTFINHNQADPIFQENNLARLQRIFKTTPLGEGGAVSWVEVGHTNRKG